MFPNQYPSTFILTNTSGITRRRNDNDDFESIASNSNKRIRRESTRIRRSKKEGSLHDNSSYEFESDEHPENIAKFTKVKGVSYNHKSKLWGASWYENGKRLDKAFSVSRYGAKVAREKAIKWRRDREIGIPYEKPAHKGTCSSVRGVHFDQRNRQWKASWSINGRRFEKTFSVSKYGECEAKSMAIQWRKDREAGIPYEKPKKTCEVRGVWYMRWSKTWVASWSENGKWVRKSFSVSKYGEQGARQRAIGCRIFHTAKSQGDGKGNLTKKSLQTLHSGIINRVTLPKPKFIKETHLQLPEIVKEVPVQQISEIGGKAHSQKMYKRTALPLVKENYVDNVSDNRQPMTTTNSQKLHSQADVRDTHHKLTLEVNTSLKENNRGVITMNPVTPPPKNTKRGIFSPRNIITPRSKFCAEALVKMLGQKETQ